MADAPADHMYRILIVTNRGTPGTFKVCKRQEKTVCRPFGAVAGPNFDKIIVKDRAPGDDEWLQNLAAVWLKPGGRIIYAGG